MASNVAKSSTHQLPLIDNLSVMETFADNIVGITANHGNVNITFASVRGDHSQIPPKNYRYVSARIVLPLSAIIELHTLLSQMFMNLEEQGIIKRNSSASSPNLVVQ